VIYTGLRQTPEAIARAAVDEDVDLVGLSVLAGGHLGLTAKVVERLRSLDARIPVVLGGVIPAEDVPRLLDAGAAGVFPSSMSLDEIVAAVGDLVASGRPANLGL
jgi:methylmalonyl-CoA mutase C-terminal domain/subunit